MSGVVLVPVVVFVVGVNLAEQVVEMEGEKGHVGAMGTAQVTELSVVEQAFLLMAEADVLTTDYVPAFLKFDEHEGSSPISGAITDTEKDSVVRYLITDVISLEQTTNISHRQLFISGHSFPHFCKI